MELLDTVAILEDLPQHNLRRGEVGTVVELYGSGAFEVEFCDGSGKTTALLALRPDQVIRLLYPQAA